MSASVIARFYCESALRTGWSHNGKPQANKGIRYTFKAVYSNDPEHPNKQFFDATPSAELSMLIDNPAAQIFEPGREYDLVFTARPVEE